MKRHRSRCYSPGWTALLYREKRRAVVYRGPRRQCKVKGDWWGWSRRDLSDVAKGGGGAKSEGWQIEVRRLPDESASPR